MPKNIGESQDAGYIGESEFSTWATKMGYYCHRSGLSIRFSKVDEHGVHHLEVTFDPSVMVTDLLDAECQQLLSLCTGNSQIEFRSGFVEPVSELPMLEIYAELAHATSVLQGLPVVNFDGWRIADVSQEDFLSLHFLCVAREQKNFLRGYGFAFGTTPFDKLLDEPVTLSLPVCMNIRGHGCVCWFSGNGHLIRDRKFHKIIGLRLLDIETVRFEKVEKPFRSGGRPVMKVCPEWPPIPLNEKELAVQFKSDEDWGVRLQWQPKA